MRVRANTLLSHSHSKNADEDSQWSTGAPPHTSYPRPHSHPHALMNYPLYRYTLPYGQYRKPRQTIPTFSVRLLRARLSRILRAPLKNLYGRSTSNVLYARDEPNERSKYTATHDVRKLPISPKDSTLVRIGDAFEISIAGFCLPTHHLKNPCDSRRLLYSIHSKDSVTFLNCQSSKRTPPPPSTSPTVTTQRKVNRKRRVMAKSSSYSANRQRLSSTTTAISNKRTVSTSAATSLKTSAHHHSKYIDDDETECRLHHDEYIQRSYPNNLPQPYSGVPASKSLLLRVNDATPCDIPFELRILETGSVGDVHSRMIQTLTEQALDRANAMNGNNDPADEGAAESSQHLPNTRFLPHVTAAIQAASISRSGAHSRTVPPRVAAAISATFCVTGENESYPHGQDPYGFEFANFEAPIPLRYGYFVLFEKTVKNKVYVNTETSELANPLSIFNVPLEHVCYVIIRVSRGVSNLPMKIFSSRHQHDAKRVESLLQLGEAIRIIQKL